MVGSFDESRVVRRNRLFFVYVPPRPPVRLEDLKRDFPAGSPPEVHYYGKVANYWIVIDPDVVNDLGLPQADLEWLREIQPKIVQMIESRP